VDFFAVLEGGSEILSLNHKGQSIVVTTVPETQFTREFDLLNDRASLVSSRAGVAMAILLRHQPSACARWRRMSGQPIDRL
jgi:hypothetical protein